MTVPPTKRRKLASSVQHSIRELEQKITQAVSQNFSLNPLADLVQLAVNSAETAEDASKAIYALYRSFVLIITNDKLTQDSGENAKVVKTWIWGQLNTYVDYLTSLMKDEEKGLRTSALQILFSLQKHLSTSSTKSASSPQFHISHFRKICSALLLCPPSRRSDHASKASDSKLDPDVLHLFYQDWFSVHDDIRWFFLREAGTILTSSGPAENLLSILERLNTFPTDSTELNAWWVTELGTRPPKPKAAKQKGNQGSMEDEGEEEPKESNEDADEDDWRKFFDDDTTTPSKEASRESTSRVYTLTLHQSLHSLASHRAVFTRAWLTLLPKLAIPDDRKKSRALAIRALNVMHRGVMPHLTRPVLVMDWIGECVDLGGAPGLLALNALFMLIKEYNLDYPSFYTRLYAFLDRDVLHLKHRARFFRMTELFLSSTHLPATLLASFVKRLSRLSLHAPPAAIIMIIPFTYNILKRHPALMVMIHQDLDEEVEKSTDPFLADEPNPLSTHAISSSLWELYSMRSHYHSAVSTLAKILEEAFTKVGYGTEDFLDSTYGTLMDTEVQRKIKKEPALAIHLAGKRKDSFINIFTPRTGGHEDVVNDLWAF